MKIHSDILDSMRAPQGIEMLGWLDGEDISKIRREIEKGAWSVKADEPLDGKVQDAFGIFLYFSERLSKEMRDSDEKAFLGPDAHLSELFIDHC